MESAAPSRAVVLSALILTVLAGGCGKRPDDPVRLVVAVRAGPPDLASFRSADEVSNSILRNAYEPLLDFDDAMAIVPCLAETWYNPDDLTWVFHLRPGVTLHDGRLLTARHVARFLERSHSDPGSLRRAGIAVRGIETPDQRTIVIRTETPAGWLPTHLARQLISVPSGVPGKLPLGTGRYRVAAWAPDGDTKLDAYPGHRDGPAVIRHLEFRSFRDPREAIRLLRAGAIDLVVDPPLGEWASMRADRRIDTKALMGLRVVLLGLDTLRPGSALADLRVRRAIAQAIDREGLVADALGGAGAPAAQLAAPGVVGYHEGAVAWPFEPATSRALLAAAGQARVLALDLDYVPERIPGVDAVVDRLVTDLGRVGIRILPRRVESAELRRRLSARESDLYLVSWLHATGDATAGYVALVQSRSTDSPAFGSLSGYSNTEVDRLIRDAEGPISRMDRRQKLQAVAELVAREVAVVPLYRQLDRYAFASGLEFVPRLDRRIRGFEVRWRPGSERVEGRP